MLGSIGGRTLAFYLMTTAIALGIALLFASIIRVGSSSEIPTDINYVAKESKSFVQVILSIIDNPVKAKAEGNLLAVIVFSILPGLSATMAGKAGEQVIDFFTCDSAVTCIVAKSQNQFDQTVFDDPDAGEINE